MHGAAAHPRRWAERPEPGAPPTVRVRQEPFGFEPLPSEDHGVNVPVCPRGHESVKVVRDGAQKRGDLALDALEMGSWTRRRAGRSGWILW
jgi:hypothetical protein